MEDLIKYLWWVLIFFSGASIGSFLNVCICRMPENKSIIYPPSSCPFCGHNLKVIDLIPIISYLFLKSKCRYCGCRISLQYPVVELITGVLFILIIAKYGVSLPALRSVILVSLVISSAGVDFKHRIIPDKLNLTGFIIGIPLVFESKEIFLSGVIGFFAAGGLLFLIAVISRGGMGGGDIKLAAVLGLLLGWQQILVALFLAFLAGSLAGLTLLMLKVVRLKEAIPFGPFLGLGAVITILAGDKIIFWYTSLFRL